MKTVFKRADDIANSDEIVVDGEVKMVYNADYTNWIEEGWWPKSVQIETTDGCIFVFGDAESIEVVVEE